MDSLPFQSSAPGTIGVELELQIIKKNSYNLTNSIQSILDLMQHHQSKWCLKPELTKNNLEINSTVHHSVTSLHNEIKTIRDVLSSYLAQTDLAVCGGGTHPFQDWKNSEIYPAEHYQQLEETYGYLARHDTIFGLHIHVGCMSGDECIYLAHILSRYIPHLICLSASSPFILEIDTSFDSTRLNISNSFHTVGSMPLFSGWKDFSAYYDELINHDVIHSISDIYWDIRPQSRLGTVEIRICDMPITIDKISEVVMYTQALCKMLLNERRQLPNNMYQFYNYNKFQSMRYGFNGIMINPFNHSHISIQDDILSTLENIFPFVNNNQFYKSLLNDVERKINGAVVLRQYYRELNCFKALIKKQIALWEAETENINIL